MKWGIGRPKRRAGGLRALEHEIEQHLLKNYLDIAGAPLLLCVVGDVGVGKTFGIKSQLRHLEVKVWELSASVLAHHLEGAALRPLIGAYHDASAALANRSAAIVIDDIDRSIASNYHDIGHTVHSQLLTGFLMDLCDEPKQIPDETKREVVSVERVPIFLTANDLHGLDAALTRPQRMRLFHFNPSTGDRVEMIGQVLAQDGAMAGSLSRQQIASLEKEYAREPIAFFSDLYADLVALALEKANGGGAHGAAQLNEIRAKRADLRRMLQVEIGSIPSKDIFERAHGLKKSRSRAHFRPGARR